MQAGTKQHLYLAQAPLTGELAALRTDTPTPPAIAHLPLLSVNLWMSPRKTHTGAHYDPQPNLLCVTCGYKHVTLWPPDCTPDLAPFPLTSESPNHSSLRMHDRAAFAAADKRAAQSGRFFSITLRAGDALLIPQGWWHEVRSAERTIAVNFWTQQLALTTPNAPPHMAQFLLRESALACMQAMRVQRLKAVRQETSRLVSAHFPGTTHLLVAAAELLHRALNGNGYHSAVPDKDACVTCVATQAPDSVAAASQQAQVGPALTSRTCLALPLLLCAHAAVASQAVGAVGGVRVMSQWWAAHEPAAPTDASRTCPFAFRACMHEVGAAVIYSQGPEGPARSHMRSQFDVSQ